MDWNNDDGFKQIVVKEGALMMLQADAGEWDELYANCSFMETFFKLEDLRP